MKISAIFFLILSLMLSGCLGDRGQQVDIIERAIFGGSSGLSKKELEAVEKGDKAIVISLCVAITPPVGIFIKNHNPVTCTTRWDNDLEGANHESITLSSSKLHPISISTVTPGEYNLEYFIAYNDDFWNTYASTTYSADELKGIAVINVQGGEVLYIGDVKLNLTDSGGEVLLSNNIESSDKKSEIIAKAISVHNNLEPVEKMLSKKYFKFSDKLQTRLIHLLPKAPKDKM